MPNYGFNSVFYFMCICFFAYVIFYIDTSSDAPRGTSLGVNMGKGKNLLILIVILKRKKILLGEYLFRDDLCWISGGGGVF